MLARRRVGASESIRMRGRTKTAPTREHIDLRRKEGERGREKGREPQITFSEAENVVRRRREAKGEEEVGATIDGYLWAE